MKHEGEPRFQTGDRVKILSGNPPGHVRTPFYVRGQTGVVERYCGHFHNPEELAYGRYEHEPIALFRVRILQTSLWPDYSGDPNDALELEVYDNWLTPA